MTARREVAKEAEKSGNSAEREKITASESWDEPDPDIFVALIGLNFFIYGCCL